jgi:hypothetical protein
LPRERSRDVAEVFLGLDALADVLLSEFLLESSDGVLEFAPFLDLAANLVIDPGGEPHDRGQWKKSPRHTDVLSNTSATTSAVRQKYVQHGHGLPVRIMRSHG